MTRVTELREPVGVRRGGRWPARWRCALATAWATLVNVDILITHWAWTDGHRYVETEDSKWRGQKVRCRLCGAEIEVKRATREEGSG